MFSRFVAQLLKLKENYRNFLLDLFQIGEETLHLLYICLDEVREPSWIFFLEFVLDLLRMTPDIYESAQRNENIEWVAGSDNDAV